MPTLLPPSTGGLFEAPAALFGTSSAAVSSHQENMAWSDLPSDLLHSISSQLTLVDILHLSTVCTRWNSAFTNDHLLQIRCIPSPWLLLPSDAGKASVTLTFRDFTLEKEKDSVFCHRRFSSLPSYIYGCRFVGSTDGWLVTLDKGLRQPRLFNPLTKAELSLPSLFTIPEVEWQRFKPRLARDGSVTLYSNEKHPRIGIMDQINFRDLYLHKIVQSSKSLRTVVVIFGFFKRLALAKPGDQSWVLGPVLPSNNTEYRDRFQDVFYHAKEQRFYAISHFSAVLSFDLNGENVQLICPMRQPGGRDSGNRTYIAFLLGSLLRIERNMLIFCNAHGINTSMTIGISVFKYVPADDASCSSSQWISIMDLGDYSLFIGCNQTFSLHHTMAPRIKPNCIYFSDHYNHWLFEDVGGDAGLFDLQNECFQYFLDSNSHANWPPSVWFTPSLS